MEYHLYMYNPRNLNGFCVTVDEVNIAIAKQEDIKTIQVVTCSTTLLVKGYRVFVHNSPSDMYEITLGTSCERTSREVRAGQCLYKMILGGVFGLPE